MTKNEFAAMLGENVNIQALMAEIEKAEDDNAVLEILKSYNLNVTMEDILSLDNEEAELDENALDDVSGGCKCSGFGKRIITNFLFWVVGKATGTKLTCLDCGH